MHIFKYLYYHQNLWKMCVIIVKIQLQQLTSL